MKTRKKVLENKKVVLIIDDDIDCSLYLENGLSNSEYSVVSVYNAEDGLDFLSNNLCDVVLLDIFLPDVDGVEVARRIRAMKGNFFPIIGITCVPIEELKSLFPEDLKHFTDICIKPFGCETIIEYLDKTGPVKRSREGFQQIIRDYQTSIPDRIELLRSLIHEFKINKNEKNLRELRLQVHKLAGSAGLFGFDEVSNICKQFDKQIGDHISLFNNSGDYSKWVKEYEKQFEKIKGAFTLKNTSKRGVLESKIRNKKAVIGVIGLGNIGLSLLDAFGRVGYSLVGYDINAKKIEMLQKNQSYLNYMDMSHLFAMQDKKLFKPSADSKILKEADVIIISVPTSMDRYGTPNLSNLRSAFEVVGKNLKKHQLIILQSSTYPGTTEMELLPILMKFKFHVGIDIYLAHVPEIADIGNENFNFVQMPRIVSGITPTCLKHVSLLYENISSKIVPCSSTKIAESAKLLQNAFRLVNISFINELKMLFDTMNIDVWEVITAAASKPFGYMPFYPSPGIGGDCIPIAPFYLVWKAKSTGGPTSMMEEAGRINDSMPQYVIKKLISGLNFQKKTIRDAKIFILGVAYKKNTNDIRESVALKIIPTLKMMLADVEYNDPFVPKLTHFADHPEYTLKSVEFNNDTLRSYDAVLVLTDHSCYNWEEIVKHSNLVIDTRNVSAKILDKRKVIKA